MTTVASRARLRMFSLASDSTSLRTVSGVERRTSMNDARMALCIARGVPLEDIDPSTGHDLSRRAYDDVRASWVRHIEMNGFSEIYDGPALAEVTARWAERRPQYTDGDDWLADGLAAHWTYWDGLGHRCGRETCDVCTAEPATIAD